MSVSSTSSSTATTSALGIGSGLDINSIIDGLMTIEAQGQTRLKNQVTQANSIISVYQQLNTKFSSLMSAGQALNLPTSWKAMAATSSSTNVSATATAAALPGTLSFVVKNLATAQTLASAGTVASTDTVIASGSMLVGQGGSIGIGNVSGSGLASGAHTIAVTQASAGASQSGATALSNSVTFTGNETITATVNGQAKTYTMAAGTYTPSALQDMLKTVSNGDLTASTNNNGSLKLTTTREGSAATLQLTGGSALSSLGLAAGASSAGTNGIVTVDGVANTVTDIRPGNANSVTLNSTAGTIAAGFSGGLRVGTTTMQNIDLGDGKLSTVVNNINSANAGMTATAVQVAPGQYKMQLQSQTTGTAGALSANFSALSASMGSFNTVTAAQDATLQVGTGAGAYNITSSSNTVTDALPGVTLNLTKADPTETVTINVAGDVKSLSDKVQAMVTAANDAVNFIKTNSTYDQKTGNSGWLLGNSTTQRLEATLHSAMSYGVNGASLGAGSSVGISVNEDGTFSFDTAKFSAAYAKNPQAVASLFVQGGTTGVSDSTSPGIAERLANLGKSATDSVSGSITTAIKGQNSTITTLQKQIADWDVRLAARRANLVSTYSAMDTAVAGFKSQQSWLTSQLASLG